MNNSKRLLALAVSAALAAPMAAYATNGMNLEGYGPIATGMGGASMAYDNGTAGMMNNPATLGLMDDGARLDLAVGILGPNVSSEMMGAGWDSSSTSFTMPAAGYASKSGKLTWGIGAFAQGGMGTEYDDANSSNMNTASPGAAAILMDGVLSDPTLMGDVAGTEEFSEVGVMRILFPVSYRVNDKLNVGGSIDYVRASMDIKMAMPGSMMMDMMMGTQAMGTLTPDATMMGGLGMFDGGIAGGYFDFADSNPYTGAATGSGFAGKLGFTYQVNEQLSVGGSYHSKTSLGDLTGDAEMSMVGNNSFFGDMAVGLDGSITVKNFQWPTTIGLGISFKANDKLTIAADVKRISWAEVMESFQMSFKASDAASNDFSGMGGPDMRGASLDAVLFQEWEDQTVYQIGGAYQVNEAMVVRLGANVANNPVPDDYLNHLFPATITSHYTAGIGYDVTSSDAVNFSLTMAPEANNTSDMGMDISHSQTSWQLMYSKKF